jgi:hypothetical protein
LLRVAIGQSGRPIRKDRPRTVAGRPEIRVSAFACSTTSFDLTVAEWLTEAA